MSSELRFSFPEASVAFKATLDPGKAIWLRHSEAGTGLGRLLVVRCLKDDVATQVLDTYFFGKQLPTHPADKTELFNASRENGANKARGELVDGAVFFDSLVLPNLGELCVLIRHADEKTGPSALSLLEAAEYARG